jgi:L-threonate 2-dehydrogenase
MARAFVRAGHHVSGFDVDGTALERLCTAGGDAKADAAEVAAAADLAVLVLRDESQIGALLDANPAFIGSFRKSSVLWVASTVSPDFVVGLGKRMASQGIYLLDGPVSGGVTYALEGKLTLILAGRNEAVAAAIAVAPAVAEHVFRIASAPGPASAVKAINQLLAASHIALTAEALGIAMRAGIDLDTLQQVICASSGASRMFADRARRMLADDVSSHATLGIFLKDLSIALETARSLKVSTPVAEAARRVFAEAASLFGEDVGDAAIFRLSRPGAQQQGGDGAVK